LFCFYLFILYFEIVPSYAFEAGLKLKILLPHLPEWWGYRYIVLPLAKKIELSKKEIIHKIYHPLSFIFTFRLALFYLFNKLNSIPKGWRYGLVIEYFV
jgi:hypothetical protein